MPVHSFRDIQAFARLTGAPVESVNRIAEEREQECEGLGLLRLAWVRDQPTDR